MLNKRGQERRSNGKQEMPEEAETERERDDQTQILTQNNQKITTQDQQAVQPGDEQKTTARPSLSHPSSSFASCFESHHEECQRPCTEAMIYKPR